MSSVSLNLARKWRSRTFREIVGQDLSVRMLQNSLYKGQFFPVYLFAGQRGCGKTSTARLFAAALNCRALPTFQKQPRDISLPCLTCDSCQAMSSGRHPDFIEIDAASHTGVDHVRQIIEAASLLPVLGNKKIYLIDEAHMLSKAAFNAFLKILEEPPMSVIFILATTDVHKIIETVRSRCFQLFFKPIEAAALCAHLEHICKEEQIPFTPDAFPLIVEHAQGSARDALNILEQVRFSSEIVNHQAVMRVLGHIDDAQLIELLRYVLAQDAQGLLQYMQAIACEQYSVSVVWDGFMDVLRAALWTSYGVAPESFHAQAEQLEALVEGQSNTRLIDYLSIMYDHELQFQKTAAQYPFFQMVLLQMCQLVEQSSSVPRIEREPKKIIQPVAPVAAAPKIPSVEMQRVVAAAPQGIWAEVLTSIAAAQDPLVTSLFAKLEYQSFNEVEKKLQVILPAQYSFFQDVLTDRRSTWQPVLDAVCKGSVLFDVALGSDTAVVNPIRKVSSQEKSSLSMTEAPKKARVVEQASSHRNEQTIDVSNKEEWQKAHAILEFFPGRITEKIEDSHGSTN